MMSKDRRDFLLLSALGAGSAAALSFIPPSIRKAMALPANNRTGTIMDVEHVVIYMQENRSFDHYFGTMNGVRGFGDPRVIRLPGGNTAWRQPSTEHPDGYVMPFHGDSFTTQSFMVDGSGSSHGTQLANLNGGRFNNWGHTKELHKRMIYYTGRDLSFYHALASAFTICDQYFSSTLSQTNPNRLHLMTGCNGGGKVGGNPDMTNDGADQTPDADMADDKPFKAFTWTTYAERLQAANISWKVYQEYDNFQDNLLAYFKNFRNISKDSPLYTRGRSWVSEHAANPADRKRSDGEQLVAAFRRDLASGSLPQVSWIVTAAHLSEHPANEPIIGENITAKFIEALVDYPEMFAKTAFIVNYDEEGGMFDHLPPPMPPVYPNDGYSTVSNAGELMYYNLPDGGRSPLYPIGFGIRVPTIIVSPWSRGGWVCSQVFDHVSTLRFLEERFGVIEENISDWRRAVTGDLTSAFDFKNPNNDWARLTLPDTADYLERIALSSRGASVTIPAVQYPTSQDPKQRLARPLPYELYADGYEEATGRFSIEFANKSHPGVVFQVYDHTDRHAPWRYTIEAGKHHTASPWSETSIEDGYELAVHGPNGFYRCFRGTAGTGGSDIRISAGYDRAQGRIMLTMENRGSAPHTLHVAQSDAYQVDPGQPRRCKYVLHSGQIALHSVSLAISDHWYDLRVTMDGNERFCYRYAGHVETGRPSKTDPAIGRMRLEES